MKETRIKVLTVITESEMGGAQVHVLDLMRGCREHCDVSVATGDCGYLTEKATSLEIPFHVVPGLRRSISPFSDVRALLALVKLVNQVRPDVIHAHTFKAGFLARIAGFLCNTPSVYTAHTWCFQPGTGAWWKRAGLLAEWIGAFFCYRIITVSEANRQMALRFHVGSPRRIATIHNGVEDVTLRSDPTRAGAPTLIMVARFVLQKDQRSLIEALSQVPGEWRLVLVGDGPTRPEIEHLVNTLGLTARVAFLGFRDDIVALLADSQVFVLTTHLEGLPLGILEAMRSGLPIVASDAGGVKETIDEGSTGFLIPHGSMAPLRSGLQKLIEDPALRERMGRASRRKYEAEFAFQSMLSKTIHLYREACGWAAELVSTRRSEA